MVAAAAAGDVGTLEAHLHAQRIQLLKALVAAVKAPADVGDPTACIKRLLSHFGDWSGAGAREEEGGETALIIAAKDGKVAVVDMLLAQCRAIGGGDGGMMGVGAVKMPSMRQMESMGALRSCLLRRMATPTL